MADCQTFSCRDLDNAMPSIRYSSSISRRCRRPSANLTIHAPDPGRLRSTGLSSGIASYGDGAPARHLPAVYAS